MSFPYKVRRTRKPDSISGLRINPRFAKQGIAVYMPGSTKNLGNSNLGDITEDKVITTTSKHGKTWQYSGSNFGNMLVLPSYTPETATAVMVVEGEHKNNSLFGSSGNGIREATGQWELRAGSNARCTTTKGIVSGEAVFAKGKANNYLLCTPRETVTGTGAYGDWGGIIGFGDKAGHQIALIVLWTGDLPSRAEAEYLVRHPWEIFSPEVDYLPISFTEAAEELAHIPYKVTRTTKPDHPVGIDWSNPLAKGLLHQDLFTSNRADVSNISPTYIGAGAAKTITRDGRSYDFDGTGDGQMSFGDVSVTDGSFGITIEVIAELDSLAAEQKVLAEWGTSAAGQSFLFSFKSDGGVQLAYHNTTDGYIIASTGASVVSTGNRCHILFSGIGSSWRCWVDGVEHNVTGDSAPSQGLKAVTTALRYGRDESGTNNFNGRLSLIRFYDDTHTFTQNEASALYQNPYQLLKPRTQYIPVGAATSGSAILATTGAISTTSIDAAIKVSPNITATTVALSVAGMGATVKVSPNITATTGAITITGADAAIKVSPNITATNGAVVLTGIDTTIQRGVNVAVTTGELSISALDTAIKISPNIVATTGSITLAGIEAAVRQGQNITATTGAMMIGGVDTAIKTDISMTATTGAVTITGIQSTILQGGQLFQTGRNRGAKSYNRPGVQSHSRSGVRSYTRRN